jgi:hypothetical protein
MQLLLSSESAILKVARLKVDSFVNVRISRAGDCGLWSQSDSLGSDTIHHCSEDWVERQVPS